MSGIHDSFPGKNWLFPRRLYNTTAFLPLTLWSAIFFSLDCLSTWNLCVISFKLSDLFSITTLSWIVLSATIYEANKLNNTVAEPSSTRANLSLSAVKMTLRSSSREAKTLRRRRRLNEEKRHSKSTCSRRESDGRHSSITCSKERGV